MRIESDLRPARSLVSRRDMLRAASCGFGYLALNGLCGAAGRPGITAVKARAKRVIFLFMAGGPSQPDLFDPKDFISQRHGQAIASPVKDHQLRVGVEKFLAMAPVAPVS